MAETIVQKENGLDRFLKEKELDKLKLMYEVFSRDENTLQHIVNSMVPYIEQIGSSIVQNDENVKDPLVFT